MIQIAEYYALMSSCNNSKGFDALTKKRLMAKKLWLRSVDRPQNVMASGMTQASRLFRTAALMQLPGNSPQAA
jgi:hypothetical protein